MENNLHKSTGLSLIIGSFLATVTMVLHPAGGSMQRIIEISTLIQNTHILAICSLPFILFGFYGLTNRLSDKSQLSMLALIIIAFGLFAAMLAALFNGIILPNFLEHYAENLENNTATIAPIVKYGFVVNKALDYVFIASLSCAISIYSIIIIRLKKLPQPIGYIGLFIFLFSIVGVTTNFAFTSLIGFRVYVFSIAAWILYAGIALIRTKK